MKIAIIFALLYLFLNITDGNDTLEDFVKDPKPRNTCYKRIEYFLHSLGYRWVAVGSGGKQIFNERLILNRLIINS